MTQDTQLTIDGLKEATQVARSFHTEAVKFNHSLQQLGQDVKAIRDGMSQVGVIFTLGFLLGCGVTVLFLRRGIQR